MKFSLLIVTLLLQYTKSSVVIDSVSQKGIYMSQFCPKAQNCPEGAHVMCMYYNPHHTMGPRCYRPKNVTITPALAETWLELTNGIRSQIALGLEKGKGGTLLPRGYGVVKLQWDSELATFAQVLANHCVLKHDLCRATKRFPDPGQTAGIVRFTHPDWIPISRKGHFTKPGLTLSKLKYSITQALRTWYREKEDVTPDMITTYSDWAKVSRETQDGRLYLEMINGPTTHMGCGMSAYTEYAYYDNRASLTYNSVQVICNYSARPKHGLPVYKHNPPAEVGYTVRCGCPEGMDEDEDCLCLHKPRTESPCSKDGDCKPAVVLLPIFTVEDAPPEKLITRSGFEMPQFNKQDFELEIPDLYVPADNTSLRILHPSMNDPPSNIHNVLSSIINEGYSKNNQPASLINSLSMDPHLPDFPNKSVRFGYSNIRIKEPHSVISNLVEQAKRDAGLRILTPHKPLIRDVKKRIFGKHPIPQLGFHNSKTIHPTLNGFKARKKSVFAKVAKFQLPKTGETIIKPAIKPRRDFGSVKNLAKDYLNFKNKGQQDFRQNVIYSPHDHQSETTTEKFLNSAEEKVLNNNYYLKNVTKSIKTPTKSLIGFDSNFSKEKSNDKLMTLLDKLEQEVKHIELDRNKKEIFDAKIRKIYGIVGETAPFQYKTDHGSDFTDAALTDLDEYESKLQRDPALAGKIHKQKPSYKNELDKPHYKNELDELQKTVENIHDKYSDYENELRPTSRSLNSLYPHSKPNQRNIIMANDGYETDMKHPFSDVEEIRANLHKTIFSSGNDIKSDHTHSDKEVLRTRNVYSDNEDKMAKYLEKRKFHNEDDPLGTERRRYYQSRLERLDRKLHNSRRHHEDNNNRQMRPVLSPTRDEQPLRPSKNRHDTFYMPDRARFLHGF